MPTSRAPPSTSATLPPPKNPPKRKKKKKKTINRFHFHPKRTKKKKSTQPFTNLVTNRLILSVTVTSVCPLSTYPSLGVFLLLIILVPHPDWQTPMAQLNYPFGEIPPLPFPNADEGSQETWLGPSQTLNSNQGSFRLFFEPTQPTTQTGAIPSSTTNNTADGNGHGVVGNNPPSTPLVLRRPVPPEIICETPKAIHIDYVVFNRAVANPAPSRSRLSLAAKDWDKLTPTSDIVWKTPIIMWTWSEFQAEVINTLTKDRDHIGDHIITLEKANLLKWKCILVQHRVYGVKSDRTVTSDTEFHPFLEAIRMSPTSKIVIKLVMEDPVVQAKKLEAVCFNPVSL
jgi:hypothetical protein